MSVSTKIGPALVTLGALVALGALAGAACTKEEGADGKAGADTAAAAAAAADPRGALVAAWKQGGLEPSPMTDATVAFGKDCKSGTVNSVDVLVCVFATPEEAKAAADAGYAWVGSATGTSTAAGALLIATADRRKADPSGRTINQLMKLAPR